MKNKFFIICFLSLFFTKTMTAQSIVIDTTFSPQQLVSDLFFLENNNVSNIKYTGHKGAIGYFSNGEEGICPRKGLILSTGYVNEAVGPNSISSETSSFLHTPGDTNLENILGSKKTWDAAVLEFDFVPKSNTMQFQFVFASDEYPEFVGSYNDIFAFFLTGKNPLGSFFNNENIALLPNSKNPITINNVNDTTNAEYYINNTYGKNISYDGLTTIITIKKDVIEGASYHLKFAIADNNDPVYDSAVLLVANSFATKHQIIADDACVGNIPFSVNVSTHLKALLWNFGDSQTSTELSPNHVYKNVGKYNVTLELIYMDSTTETIVKEIEIYEIPEKPVIRYDK